MRTLEEIKEAHADIEHGYMVYEIERIEEELINHGQGATHNQKAAERFANIGCVVSYQDRNLRYIIKLSEN